MTICCKLVQTPLQLVYDILARKVHILCIHLREAIHQADIIQQKVSEDPQATIKMAKKLLVEDSSLLMILPEQTQA